MLALVLLGWNAGCEPKAAAEQKDSGNYYIWAGIMPITVVEDPKHNVVCYDGDKGELACVVLPSKGLPPVADTPKEPAKP